MPAIRAISTPRERVIGWWNEGQELLERVIHASGDRTGRPRPPGDARSILAVNATDAAQAHYLGDHVL